MSLTNPRKKAPILRLAAHDGVCGRTRGSPWTQQARNGALAGAYRPARGPEEPVYVVIRRDWDGEQRLLAPASTVILVSQDRLPLAELVRRHRGQQGHERAFQRPLTDLAQV